MNERTGDELKQIAIDLHHGKIYCDQHIPQGESIATAFMVLAFMDAPAIQQLQDDPPGMIYEYLDKAGPRSVNGMPCFFSMQMLSQSDAKIVCDTANKIRDAERAMQLEVTA